MPTNQDIVLNLVAKLDQGNIQSEVQNLANSMTTAFESAFENLGARLAQQMIRALSTGGQSVAAQVQSMAPGQLVDLAGRPMSSTASPAASSAYPMPQMGFYGPGNPATLSQFAGGFANTAPSAAAATAEMMGLRAENRFGMRLAAQARDPLADVEMGYESFGARYAEARSIVAARKMGTQIDLEPEQRKRLEETQQSVQKAQEALIKEIFALNENIVKNTKALADNKDATSEQKDALRRQIAEDSLARNESSRQAERLTEIGKTSQAALGEASGMGALTKFGGAALALSQLGGAAIQIPGALRQRQVALAGIQGMAGQAAMAGDIEKLMAAQQLGGFGAVESESFYEQMGRTGVAGLGILGGAAVGAKIGTMFAPVLPGLSTAAGAAIGGGIGLANFIGTSLGFSSGQRSLMEERLGVERAKAPEFYEAMQRSRGLALGGFEAARGMGTPELAMLAAGGGAGIEALMQQDVQLQNQMQRQIGAFRQRSLQEPLPISVIENMPLLDQGLLEARSNIERTEMSRADLQKQIAASRQFAMGDQSLRGYAAGFGVGPEQFAGLMQRSIGAMGGVFLGQTPELMQNVSGLAQMARLTGLGLGQAPEIAGALVQGGMGRGAAMESTRQMFEDAVSAGLDKARVGQALITTATRAEQLGIGGAYTAQLEQRQALAAAQAMAGGGPIEGSQMGLAQQAVQTLTEMSTGESGLGMVGGLRAARQFGGDITRRIRQAGGKVRGLGSVDIQMLQQMEFDPSSLKEFFKRRGVSEEALSQIDFEAEAERLKQMKTTGAYEATRTGTGGTEEQTAFLLARSRGIRSAGAMYQFGAGVGAVVSGARPTAINILPEDIQKYGFAEAERMAKDRASTQMEEAVTGTQAGQLAVQQAQMGALQAGSGMQTLDQQAAVLATAFQNLAERTNQLFADRSKAPAPPSPPPMTPRQVEQRMRDILPNEFGGRNSSGTAKSPVGGGRSVNSSRR